MRCLDAKLLENFLTELSDFQKHLGSFAPSYPWFITEDNELLMSAMRRPAWAKQRSLVPWAEGSNLRLRV